MDTESLISKAMNVGLITQKTYFDAEIIGWRDYTNYDTQAEALESILEDIKYALESVNEYDRKRAHVFLKKLDLKPEDVDGLLVKVGEKVAVIFREKMEDEALDEKKLREFVKLTNEGNDDE